MGFDPGKGWDKESEELFIHDSGTRISKTTYRGKLGWWVLPVDLDAPPMEFAATDAGRAEAFAAFSKGIPKPKPKPKKAEAKVAAKGGEDDEEEGAHGRRGGDDEEPGPAEPAEEAAADDDEEDEEEEEDEKEEKGE